MGKSKKSSKKKQKYSVQDLLDRVSEYLDCFQFELAIKFCEKALELEPSNVKVLETSGNVYADIGDEENCKKCFLKAVEVQPDHGHEKYMYLGQMFSGDEAKSYYLKGIEIMKKTLENDWSMLENKAPNASNITEPCPSVTARDVSSAYCSIAEIYLTDSCEQEDAERNCAEFCSLAMESDKTNPDALIVMANFLLSKDDKEEAKNVLTKCFDLLKITKVKPMELTDNGEIRTDDVESSEVTEKVTPNESNECDEEKAALYSSRSVLAKLLIEIGEFDKAEAVLMELLEANDEDIEVWHMLGWNMHLKNQPSDAKFFLTKAVKLYEKLHCDDEELLEHLKGLLDKCSTDENSEESEEEMDTE